MVVDAGKNQDDSKPAEVDREDGFWMIFLVGWTMTTQCRTRTRTGRRPWDRMEDGTPRIGELDGR